MSKSAASSASAPRLNVLVVDDEKNIRSVLVACLESAGCRAVEAATLDVRVPQRTPGQPGQAGSVVRTVSVTISIGVAQPPGRHADPHGVLRAADLALDRAKQAGQNRVSA